MLVYLHNFFFFFFYETGHPYSKSWQPCNNWIHITPELPIICTYNLGQIHGAIFSQQNSANLYHQRNNPRLNQLCSYFSIWGNTSWTDSLASFLLHPTRHSSHTSGSTHWYTAAALSWDLSGAEAASPRLLAESFGVSWVCSSATTTNKCMALQKLQPKLYARGNSCTVENNLKSTTYHGCWSIN